VFDCKEQVRVWNEIVDSNFIADISIGTPGEHDYSVLLNANSDAMKQIISDERQRLGSIKICIGILATMRCSCNHQEGLFDIETFYTGDEKGDNNYDYKFNVPFKTRYMPVLMATNINDTFDFGLYRIADKIDKYISYGSGWQFYRVEKIFIEVTRF